MSRISLSIRISIIVRALVAVSLFLIVLSVIFMLIKFSDNGGQPVNELFFDLFFLGLEGNFPTYYISFLCLFSALLFLLISLVEIRKRLSHAIKWGILCIGFLYISVDEIVMIHERFIDPVAALLGGGDLGILTFAWVVPAMIIVVILIAVYFKFLLEMDKTTRFFVLIAAAVFIAGALGMELLGGYYFALNGGENITYLTMQTIEESMEMFGLIILIWGLLRHISKQFGIVGLDFTGGSD